jgi:2-dehydropantoate 2-reductase
VISVSKKNSIAIVGAGALGSYYGARLALAGSDVRFLLRSEFAAVRERGLTLRERDGVRRLEKVAAFETTAEIGPVDLVLITLKTTANAELARLLPPLIGPNTAVVTLQNGLGNEERVASLVGAERVLGGLCFIAVVRTAPGELTGFHTPGSITLGEYGRPATARTRAIAARFVAAGVSCTAVDSLLEARWRKLIWNIPFNGLAVTHNATTDRLCADPTLAAEVRALMVEVQRGAAAFGIAIPDEFLRQQFDVTPPMGAYQPSSLVDFRAGREVEVETIWGEPLRRAKNSGIALPRLEKLYAELKRVAPGGKK